MRDEKLLALCEFASELADDVANFLSSEQILPCDEGDVIAESLTLLAMNLRSAIAAKIGGCDAGGNQQVAQAD